MSLEVQVIDVQLSDCIAGSSSRKAKVQEGTTEAKEVSNEIFGGSDKTVFETW